MQTAPYVSFALLQANETEGADYRIRMRNGHSGIAIMSVHGGGIEPGTTEIAEALAEKSHTFYTFSGLKRAGNARLHITSRKFDEPLGISIAREAQTIITIHGCRDLKAMTFLGGRYQQLKKEIKAALTTENFPVAEAKRFPGVNPKNICNRNRLGMGVQLEISIGMRRLLFEDIHRLHRKRITPVFSAYVHALDEGVKSFLFRQQHSKHFEL